MLNLHDAFTYSESHPLLFTQLLFWLMFIVFMAGYSLIFKTGLLRRIFLIYFGIFFYYKSGGYFFSLLLLTTVTDFYFGKAIRAARKSSWSKFYMICSISTNLLLLGYFKYFGFFTQQMNLLFGTNFQVYNFLSGFTNASFGTHLATDSIFLPIGISFFTFQAISYAIDVYRRKIEPLTNILDYCFFVTYFPQLLAGPIVRAVDFVPQIHRPYELTKSNFGRAFYLILCGLIKKIFISDYISGNFVDRVFEHPNLYSGFENLMAVYGYTIQIYCDFSGYTDIAIGLGILLGYHLPLNFNSPYKSINITDFWRRWHISLSTWLKDYLYISLGGNRKGTFRTYFNLFITMLLGGLWHGAHLRFILWGGLHGLALAIHKLWMRLFPRLSASRNIILNLVSGLITFHFVAWCWMYFRAPDLDIVNKMLHQIFTDLNIALVPKVVEGYRNVFAVIGIGYLIHLFPQRWKDAVREAFTASPLIGKAAIISLVVIGLVQVASTAVQPFIYFQF